MTALKRIEDFADGFDPFGALLTVGGEGHIEDPLQKLVALGQSHPVYEADMQTFFGAPRQLVFSADTPAFLIIGYDEVNQVLLDADTYSNKIYEMHVGLVFGRSITTMDGDEHRKYRALFQQGFTPRMLQALRTRFQAVIDRLMAHFAQEGHADLVSQFALHFPFSFICDLMDLPESDRPIFHKLAHGQTVVAYDLAHGKEASGKLGSYLSALIEERRALKSDTDFVSIMVNAEAGGQRLPEEVLLGFFRQLMNAGGDTSFQSFSNILAALFENPGQLDIIRRDRSVIPRAIEEGVRYGAPITAVDRITTRDTELAGVKMPKGSIIRVCVAAANRDPRVWNDPHQFNILREQHRAVTFGYGAHVCIGQHLGRMELQMALESLLDRLPNIRLDRGKPLPKARGLTFRGTDAVHVVWDLPVTWQHVGA